MSRQSPLSPISADGDGQQEDQSRQPHQPTLALDPEIIASMITALELQSPVYFMINLDG